jgi:hypothetical protein
MTPVNIPVMAGILVAVPVLAVPACVLCLLHRMHNSVGVLPGTAAQRAEEVPEQHCVLFRHLPQLVDVLAWRRLGAVRTPIHRCSVALPDGGA